MPIQRTSSLFGEPAVSLVPEDALFGTPEITESDTGATSHTCDATTVTCDMTTVTMDAA